MSTASTTGQAKVALIDASSATVKWLNQAALSDIPDLDPAEIPGAALERAVPMASILGVPEAIAETSENGGTRTFSTNLVSTRQGSLAIVGTLDRLPNGDLLLVIENAWQADPSRGGAPARSSGLRRR